MKFTTLFPAILILLVFLILLPGCSSGDANEVSAVAPSTQVPATPSVTMLSPTLEATLSPATETTIEPTSKPTIKPTLKPTPKPTPKPTLAPTSKPTADSKTVVLAEGFYYKKLDDALKKRITGMSYPSDVESCKVSYDDLRYIKLLHYDFDGNVHEGELIVNAKLADEVMEIFYKLHKAKYPLTSVRLVDDYGEPGNDNLSMAANNTSAFNYRVVTGSKTLSRHSYGAAIDINPMLNPYMDGGRIAPENGAAYADRKKEFAGKIDHEDLCYKLFIENGWTWGGDWSGDKDYQHFSKKI